MKEKKLRIALLTAHIGYSEKPELTITDECEKELKDFGVDVFRFNNLNVDELKGFFIPSKKRKETYKETLEIKLRYWYKSLFVYRQALYPTAEENYNRLIAKIPKILFYKLVPNDYDFYIWCDSKFTLKHGFINYIMSLIEEFSSVDMIVSSHGYRNSIQEEFFFMAHHMRRYKTMSLLTKYNIAMMDKQLAIYKKDKQFKDDKLYELPIIIYSSNILQKKGFLEDWYAHNFYFTIQDQLSLPYLVYKHKVQIAAKQQNIFENEFATHEHY